MPTHIHLLYLLNDLHTVVFFFIGSSKQEQAWRHLACFTVIPVVVNLVTARKLLTLPKSF